MTDLSGKKKGSLTSQSAWILVAKVAGFALNTALPLLVVRHLSQEGVGVYRQAFLLASNAVLVLPLGFAMSAYYFLNREPEKQGAAVFNILLFNFAAGGLAFLLLLFFPGVLGLAFQDPELVRLAPLIGALIWLWLFSGFLETAALSLQEARLGAAFIVLSQFGKTSLMLAAVVNFGTVDSIIYAGLILFSLQSAVMLAYIQRRFPGFWRHLDLKFFKRQLAYSLPYGLSVLVYVGQTDMHNYFISHSFSAAEFAIYSVGCFQLPLIAMLYESVGAVLIPKMSELQSSHDNREMLRLSAVATQKLAFFYFPIFAFLMIVAFEFVTTLFTTQYAASTQIFRVNLLVLPLFSLAADPVLRAFPKAGSLILRVRIVICVLLGLTFWLGLGSFGLVETIGIVAAALIVEKIFCAVVAARMVGASISDLDLLGGTAKLAASALIAGIALSVFYFFCRGLLMDVSREFAGSVLGRAGSGNGVDFVAGAVFLGCCLLVFVPVYLLVAALFGAIDPRESAKALRPVKRFFPRRFAGSKAA
jgi:O-antigen/teichoic acid export membrane protein